MLTYKVGKMIKVLPLLFLFAFSPLMAQVKLEVGDVLLQPLKCWACSLIEAEEDTIFSHAGVVIQISPEVKVAEAFGKVRLISFDEFDAKTEKGQKLVVLRPKKSRIREIFFEDYELLLKIFKENFEHRKYDHDFRWDNRDQNQQELIYCTELVAKLYWSFAGIQLPLKKMHFEKNREDWILYFKGSVPDGEWGNSPGDFERSNFFDHVGEL